MEGFVEVLEQGSELIPKIVNDIYNMFPVFIKENYINGFEIVKNQLQNEEIKKELILLIESDDPNPDLINDLFFGNSKDLSMSYMFNSELLRVLKIYHTNTPKTKKEPTNEEEAPTNEEEEAPTNEEEAQVNEEEAQVNEEEAPSTLSDGDAWTQMIEVVSKKLYNLAKQKGGQKANDVKMQIEILGNDILWIYGTIALKVCAIVAISIILLAIISGTMSKSTVIDDYNNMVMNQNGQILLNNAQECISMLYDDIVKNDVYKIKGAGAMITGSATVLNHPNISFNPWQDKDKVEGDPPASQYFQLILQNVNMTNSAKVDTSGSNTNLETIYNNCINIVESYNKCNSLFTLSGGYPFPIIEVTVYGIILIVSFVVIGYVVSELEPVKSFKDIKLYNLLIDRLERRLPISEEDLPEKLMEWSHDDDMREGKFVSIMVIIGSVLLLVFGIIFAVLSMNSGSDLQGVLYGSKLFQDLQCYGA
jgi:hypothetical protein